MEAKFIYETIRESINFERGLDPKDSLRVGIRNKRSFKTVRECAQFFIDNIEKLSEGRFQNPEDLKRAFQDQKYANEIVSKRNPQINKSPLRMSKDYLDGFIERDALGNTLEHKYPPLYIEEWGTDFHHVLEKLKSLRDFHIDLQRILGIHKEGKLKESIDFERGLDPKQAMGIGISTWENLKPGDVLKAKIGIGIESSGRLNNSSNYDRIPFGWYILVDHIKIHPDGKAMAIDYYWNDELPILKTHLTRRIWGDS